MFSTLLSLVSPCPPHHSLLWRGRGEAFYLQLAIPRVVATAESTEIIMLMMNFQVSLCFMAYMVLKG
jgi:hypothetical protein